ncbi:MAG: hypothetical protein Q8P57_00135 [Candidatus Pacearchaeota archaeon]|nr:hypothetical protein [Candidatus Pacearchaeota archaeon]
MKKENDIIIITAVILGLFLIFSGFRMAGFGGCGMMGYWSGLGFMWIFMTIIWILVIVALVLGIIWLIRQLQNSGEVSRSNRRKRK